MTATLQDDAIGIRKSDKAVLTASVPSEEDDEPENTRGPLFRGGQGCTSERNWDKVRLRARHGWEVVGVDISLIAILRARWRAFTADARCQFHRADVTDLHFLKDPFNLALDIGCLHSLPLDSRQPYASEIGRLTRPGGWYMLYAFTPRPPESPARGIAPDGVEALFNPAFRIERQEGGEDPTGSSSAWYWLRRTTRADASNSRE